MQVVSTIYEDKVSSPRTSGAHHASVSTPSLVMEGPPLDKGSSNSKKTNKPLILLYFMLWFLLSTGYNIFNKKAMNLIKLPWLVGTAQMFIGIPLFSMLWLTKVRKVPRLSLSDWLTLLPLGAFHSGCHICAVLSMSAGSVTFAHIIKSGEPITTSILSGLLLSEVYAWQVYASLIPVISGVAIASISEPGFSFFAFLSAMGSNLFSSLRSVYSKKKMSSPVGENLDARNLYAILTIISFMILAPLALIMEGSKVSALWTAAVATEGVSSGQIIFHVTMSSLCYYYYNEMAFSALELVSPVTHAVGSTFKRVFIIGGAIIAFKNYPDLMGYLGITIAIVGVGVYSLTKNKYKSKSVLVKDLNVEKV